MDITPIYELQSRLRSAAIAGSNLLSEDFRLERAAKDMQGLSKASPVFGKINGLMDKLLAAENEERAGLLLEALTLVDAVLCTMAAVEVPDTVTIEKIEVAGEESVIANAPYSLLSTLIEALTTSGSGHYNQVLEAREKHPELFKDYRVKHALVQGLGASYAELADMVMDWMIQEQDKSMVTLLKKDFEPKGGKAMVRRVWVMEALSGGEENEFYIKTFPEAEKDVRKALIFALRHDKNNVGLLLDLTKSERGAAKKAAIHALAFQEGLEVEEYFKKFAQKKKMDVLEYFQGVNSKWAADLAAEVLLDSMDEQVEETMKKLGVSSTNAFIHNGLLGKSGEKIAELYRRQKPSRDLAILMLESYICTRDTYLRDAALDIMREGGKKEQVAPYYAVVVMSKMLEDDNAAEWLKQELSDRESYGFESLTVKKRMVAKALSYIHFTGEKYQLKVSYYDDILGRWETLWYDCPCDIKGTWVDILMEYPSKELDAVLYQWLDEDDVQMCDKCKEWFSKRAFQNPERTYLSYLKKCKADYIPGLAREYVKKTSNAQTWSLQVFLENMPGNAQQKKEEIKMIQEFLKETKEKRDISQKFLESWLDNWTEE